MLVVRFDHRISLISLMRQYSQYKREGDYQGGSSDVHLLLGLYSSANFLSSDFQLDNYVRNKRIGMNINRGIEKIIKRK